MFESSRSAPEVGQFEPVDPDGVGAEVDHEHALGSDAIAGVVGEPASRGARAAM
jgi:hypothetical protein